MGAIKQPAQARSLRKQILTVLYDLYLFPQSDRGLAAVLKGRNSSVDIEKVKDCFTYLEKKGYVVTTGRSREGDVLASVTALGVDMVEGAIKDRGILPSDHELAGLSVKKEVRRVILAFLRLYPESFNADDEIVAELRELGMGAVFIDQVRFHIWYLSEKKLVEMKTHQMRFDIIHFARITALGMDLLEGSVSDHGVGGNE